MAPINFFACWYWEGGRHDVSPVLLFTKYFFFDDTLAAFQLPKDLMASLFFNCNRHEQKINAEIVSKPNRTPVISHRKVPEGASWAFEKRGGFPIGSVR